MDASSFIAMQIAGGDDDEVADDMEHQIITTAALLTAGAATSRLIRNEQRKPSRNYLTRRELPPNPHLGTAWRSLFESQNDRAFITTMGFDLATFKCIIDSGFKQRWLAQPIPRRDASTSGSSRPGGRSLDTDGALGLVLHYLNSTMLETSLQQIFGLIPTTVSRYITFGLDILLQTLRQMPEAEIQWPAQQEDFEQYTEIIVARHPRLDGAFGSIDGLNLPTETSKDVDIENATYNGWFSEHFISSVLVFVPDGRISSLY